MTQADRQTVAHFHIRIVEIITYLILLFIGVFFLYIQLRWHIPWQSFFLPVNIVLCIFCLLQLLWYLFKPYISISKNMIIVNPGIFNKTKKYPFDEIVKIEHINPESKIKFHTKDGKRIQLPFYRLSKKNRIRFVFLVESDFNRKHTFIPEKSKQ